jgi:histidyl-tRNA synthetase
MKKRYRSLRGARDILPVEIPRWHFLERVARDVFESYAFSEIRTPIIEYTELFTRSVGESSDIVSKEMYTFTRGDESMTLRPESTASVVRAFVEHSLHRGVAGGYPERLYYIGPMFRHERPQKGRQREFHQIGVEVLGSAEPLADAETIQMIDRFLERLGIVERKLVLSSVGDDACRPAFREALREWLEPRLGNLCDDCNRRYRDNPMRVFDCKVDEDQAQLAGAPTMLEMLCGDCTGHLDAVRSALDDYGVPYEIDPRLVRGLDYYKRTVFEVQSSALGAQNAILGGGRYDGLVAELGGSDVPGFGAAIGMERLVMLLPEDRIGDASVDVALIALGAEGFAASVAMASRLRAAGVSVLSPLTERPMGAQLKRADKARARFAVFVGRDELAAGSFGFKNLRTGEQIALGEQQIVSRAGETDEC